MPKDYFQDITPPNPKESGRSIRDIPISHRERTSNPPADIDQNKPITATSRGMADKVSNVGPLVRRIVIWGVALAAVLALAFVTIAMFRGTSVVVSPRVHSIVLAEDIPLTAYAKNIENAVPGALTYEMVESVHESSSSVPATGFTEVQESASGIITIYNEYTSGPVRLIKNTRFETPNGLVYRIRGSIVIPGKRDNSPGTVTATVYADEPGEKYNITPVNRFTLPGLKDGPMYSSVYARSSSSFTGGFVGSKPRVADSDLEIARRALRATIEAEARAQADLVSSSGTITFPQLLELTFESLPLEQNAEGGALVRERVTAHLPSFSEDLFAKVLAVATRADAGDEIIHLKNIESIQIRKINTTPESVSGVSDPIDMLVSGNATLVWDVDVTALASALAGTSKTTFQNIISSFAGVEKADAFIRPFWRDSFSSNPSDISIIINEVE
jgi:hypothetical protein